MALVLVLYGQANRNQIYTSPDLIIGKDTMHTCDFHAFSVPVFIEKFDHVTELKLLKVARDSAELYSQMSQPVLEDSMVFRYQVEDTHPGLFRFIFNFFGEQGEKINEKILSVDARSGIVPCDLVRISMVTGKSLEEECLTNPNHTDECYEVGSTDRGITWMMDNGRTGLFIGDTFGKGFKPIPRGGGNGGNWRSNVFAFSVDGNPDDGMIFSGMEVNENGGAREIVRSAHDRSGTGDFSSIPSAAIRVCGVDNVHYMSIRKWGCSGRCFYNYSRFCSLSDDGKTWKKCEELFFSTQSNFSQVAFAKKGCHIYMLGIVPVRFGYAFLARIRKKDILNHDEYEYWNNNKGWVKADESMATPLFSGPFGKMSLVYNTRFDRLIVTYLNSQKESLVLRDAILVAGPWSKEKILVSAKEYP